MGDDGNISSVDSIFALQIISSQVFGAFLGCLISRGGVSDKSGSFSPNVAKLCPFSGDCSISSDWFYVFILEMASTTIFTTLIMHIKRINGSKKDDILNAASIALT